MGMCETKTTRGRRGVVVSVVVSLWALAAQRAEAQTLQPGPVAATPSGLSGGPPELTSVLVAPGRTELRIPLVINLSEGAAGKPFNIPLDVYYGVNDRLTLGLTHSGGVVQPTSPYPRFSGLCLSGTKNGCGKVYNNVGFDALYAFLTGTLQLAGHGGLEVASLDPARFALRLGVLFQAPLASRVALLVDPRFVIGLNERDDNKDHLVLPLGVQFWATEPLRLAVRTVFAGQLNDFKNTNSGSLGIFGGYRFAPAVEGFASFDFLNLYGHDGGGESRSLVLGANILL